MKRKLIMGLFVAVFAAVGLSSSGVKADNPTTAVTGVVTENQMAVAGALVTVTCNGHTRTDTTDAMGSYLVTFPAADCPFGSTVKVVAQKGGKSGVNSGTVTGVTTKFNLAIVNVPIPEYGLIGTLLAGGAGLGLMAYMRRRQQSSQF